MRRSIFMYLFFFAALWIVFQYANEKKIFGAQEQEIASLRERLATASDSLERVSANQENGNAYFGLDRNESAYNYFDKFNVDTQNLESRIEDALISKNSTTGNLVVPFENTNGVYRVNKIQILNHKWIIADFTDGKRWGELLLQYSINGDNKIEFENLESLIYPLE